VIGHRKSSYCCCRSSLIRLVLIPLASLIPLSIHPSPLSSSAQAWVQLQVRLELRGQTWDSPDSQERPGIRDWWGL
jgi:hypothetical protein